MQSLKGYEVVDESVLVKRKGVGRDGLKGGKPAARSAADALVVHFVDDVWGSGAGVKRDLKLLGQRIKLGPIETLQPGGEDRFGDRTWSHKAGDEWNLIQWKSEREIIQEPARGWGKEQRNERWGRVAGETYEPGSVDCDDQGVVEGGEEVEEEWAGGEFSSEDEDAILDSSHAGELSALKMLAKELWCSLFLIDKLTGKFPEVNVYINSEALYACLRSGKVTKEPQLQLELDYVI
uniref:Uncharacterized protein n=1 Tax=Chromera velia CCMP2878 TaxID=1169474 RepID=A0A0G4FBW4_9ALVE|eukprot:Cvel_16218.t1-p1 / transcript=Cvel_16218.t1 / gene=Cvel_16218 / organism=Chromera_velia_CCMP2878 / gene_product=hypothetical protein / transcript_product=hypothetical protein / location=Cvel_scaffold1240:6028-7176(-) / protein_length=235 / sequence_SO=supercontig / SO=protein_coding / is_pseudo=false